MQFFKVIYPTHSFLVRDDGHAGPSVALIGVSPSFNVAGILADSRVQTLDAVGRAEAFSEQLTHAQPLQGKGVLQPLLEGSGRPVQLLQIGVQTFQILPGQFVVGLFMCLVQPPFHFRLLALGQAAQYVFPFVPLATLDHGCQAEDFFESLFNAFGPLPAWLAYSISR